MIGNIKPETRDADFAALNKAIVESATYRQNEKKKGLLSKSKITHSIPKKDESLGKVTQRENLSSHSKLWMKCSYTFSNFSQLVEDINSKDRFSQYRGIIGIRKLLANEGPPIQSVIDAGLVPRLIEFMKIEDEPDLQLEAAWSLTNIVSGTVDQTQIVVDKGAIPWFIKLLGSKNPMLEEQAIWALGNIAGDSSAKRDLLLKLGVLQPLLSVIGRSNVNKAVVKQGIWAISNLCRGRPLPRREYVNSAIPTLCRALHSQTDIDIISDAIWALSYLLRDGDFGIRNIEVAVKNENVIPALISVIGSDFQSVLVPCLRTFANICCGEDAYIDAMVEHPKFLKRMFSLLNNTKKSVRKETLWVLSNIVAGSPQNISRIFESAPFVEKLISCIKNDVDDIKTEALFVFSNTFRHENIDNFLTLWDAKVLDCYLLMLQTPIDTTTTRVIVEGIYHMLKVGGKLANEKNSEENIVLVGLEKEGVLDKFDMLQDHVDESVQFNVRKMIREFMPFIKIKPLPEDSQDDEDDCFDEDHESDEDS